MANSKIENLKWATVVPVSLAAFLLYDHMMKGNKSFLCKIIPGFCGPKGPLLKTDPDAGLTEKERIKKHHPNVEFVPDEPVLRKLPHMDRPFYKSSTHVLGDEHWPIDIANGYTY